MYKYSSVVIFYVKTIVSRRLRETCVVYGKQLKNVDCSHRKREETKVVRRFARLN